MAPGYASEVSSMLDFAIKHDHPTSIRYPKASALQSGHTPAPIELGKSEIVRQGNDGTIIAFGAMLENALEAAERLEGELDIAVVNARFAKPIDEEMVRHSLESGRFVITLEEGTKLGGFGSAFLENATQQGLDTRKVSILALPDEFIEHGDRDDLLHEHGLSAAAIAETCREAAASEAHQSL